MHKLHAAMARVTGVITIALATWGMPAVSVDAGPSTPPVAGVTQPAHAAGGRTTLDSLPDIAPLSARSSSGTRLSAPADGTGQVYAGTPDGERFGIGLPVDDSAIAATTPKGSAVYVDLGKNVDVAVQGVQVDDLPEVASAVRAIITIRDSKAPRRYAFPLELPEGASLVKQRDGGVQVRDTDGGALGIVTKPWAVDAAGKDLPTRYIVRGNKLIQHVDHRGATYPVLADPVWFVPVAVVGSRVAVKIAVKALTKKGAKRAAKKIAKKNGHKVKSVGSPI